MASGGGLSRFGMEWALYMLELVGVAVMYTGFIKSEEGIKQKGRLSKQLKIRLSEDLMSSLRQLEEEKFLVSDPRIWKLTARGEAAAFVLESSQKKHLYLLLFCLPLCVVIVLTILAESL
ncbi:MAG: hypothetical protein OIN88_04855 [Candidatus Methanoperedens sp.]|nr:hypothetical protein [Candidatus Methanoperedens sp.]